MTSIDDTPAKQLRWRSSTPSRHSGEPTSAPDLISGRYQLGSSGQSDLSGAAAALKWDWTLIAEQKNRSSGEVPSPSPCPDSA